MCFAQGRQELTKLQNNLRLVPKVDISSLIYLNKIEIFKGNSLITNIYCKNYAIKERRWS